MAQLSDFIGSSGGGAFEAVARGSISEKALVALNSDATVSEVISSGSFGSAGAEATMGQFDARNTAIFLRPSGTEIVVFYSNASSSYTAWAIVGSISGDIITFGSPVAVINESNSYSPQFTYDSAADRYVVVNNHSGYYCYGKVIRVDGTTVTVGTRIQISVQNAKTSKSPLLVYDPVVNRHLAVYDEYNSPYQLTGVLLSVSDMTLTKVTSLTLTPNSSDSWYSLDWEPVSGKLLLSYQGASNYLQGVVVTITATTISKGAEHTILAESSATGVAVLDPVEGKLLWPVYRTGETAMLAYLNIEGTTASLETIQIGGFAAGDLGFDASNDLVASYVSSGSPYVVHNKRVNGQFIENTPYKINAKSIAGTKLVYVPNSAKFAVWSYPSGNNPNVAQLVTPQSLATNAGSHIGFAVSSANDGAAVKVSTTGSVVDGLLGLTTGQNYNVEHDATLTPATTDYGAIGRAVSPTKLMITANGSEVAP